MAFKVFIYFEGLAVSLSLTTYIKKLAALLPDSVCFPKNGIVMPKQTDHLCIPFNRKKRFILLASYTSPLVLPVPLLLLGQSKYFCSPRLIYP